MPARPLNATAASLLGFLHDGPMTGWDLVTVAEQRIGAFWSLTQSQVYRELTAMAAAGLVRAGERGPRDRQPYEITTPDGPRSPSGSNGLPGRRRSGFPCCSPCSSAGTCRRSGWPDSWTRTEPRTRSGWRSTRRPRRG
ncbi:PadR family transcriptional regulator [Micromonospora sp. ATA32]|nr:PadR family transcriptional regulator [Micromonospora sp. ATA32]